MSRKVITMYEETSTFGNKTIIYKGGIVKESLLSSILSDTYTYGILLLSFWVNQAFIHSRIVSTILLFSFIFSLFFSTNKKNVSKEEFKKIMNEHLKDKENS